MKHSESVDGERLEPTGGRSTNRNTKQVGTNAFLNKAIDAVLKQLRQPL